MSDPRDTLRQSDPLWGAIYDAAHPTPIDFPTGDGSDTPVNGFGPTPRAEGLREDEPVLTAIRQDHRVVHRPGVHGEESWCDEDNVRQPCDTQVVLGIIDARAALAASDTAPGLDVRRVKQAVTNIAVRHGLTKDPPEPNWTLHSMYGYSRSTPDMDAEIAAEYARLASPDPTDKPRRRMESAPPGTFRPR